MNRKHVLNAICCREFHLPISLLTYASRIVTICFRRFEIARAFNRTLYYNFGIEQQPLALPAKFPSRTCLTPATLRFIPAKSVSDSHGTLYMAHMAMRFKFGKKASNGQQTLRTILESDTWIPFGQRREQHGSLE